MRAITKLRKLTQNNDLNISLDDNGLLMIVTHRDYGISHMIRAKTINLMANEALMWEKHLDKKWKQELYLTEKKGSVSV